MALLAGVTIKLGTSAGDASAATRATDNATPYVAWELPTGITQVRFSVRITNAEPGGTAFTTSGPRTSTEKFFHFPAGVGLNENFSGLCAIEVAISQSDTGAFEYVSAPFYFVYDRVLEKMIRPDGVDISWNAAVDSDGLPLGGVRVFHLQVSEDPLFTTLVFEDNAIVDETRPTITYTPEGFDPGVRYYFYRVRQGDGLDFGDWSKVNVFRAVDNTPPELTIVSATPLGNDDGDIVISFVLTDPDSAWDLIDFTYTVPNDGVRHPMSLGSPPAVVPDGVRQIIWHSNRDLPFVRTVGVVIYGVPSDLTGSGIEARLSPITVDNSDIVRPGGGFGSTIHNYGVAGHLARRSVPAFEEELPVHQTYLAVLQEIVTLVREQMPTGGSWWAWSGAGLLAPLETSGGSANPVEPNHGFENPTADPAYLWATIIAAAWDSTAFGRMLGHTGVSYQAFAFSAGRGPLNPHATSGRWLFESPLAYSSHSDGWPRPHSSRDLPRARFLKGYVDQDGTARDYPDGYDWDHRPSWHVGREIFGVNDAWIQVVHIGLTDHPECATCKGKGWVVAGTGPYVRVDCPNPNCADGFDRSLEPFMRDGRSFVNAYRRPVWYRLTHFLENRPYADESRVGLAIPAPSVHAATQHIVGRHLSSLEDRGSFIFNGTTFVAVTRPAEWEVTDPQIKSVTRQPEDAADAQGYLGQLKRLLTETEENWPTSGLLHEANDFDGGVVPAQGQHGPLKSDYFWGVDPDSNPGHGSRPTPTDDWNIRVTGQIGRVYRIYPLQFRFLQSYWDAYNTIHFRATGSETSQYHMQISVYNGDTPGEWTDVRGDNTVIDESSGLPLIPALTFFLYLNTINRTRFPAGRKYRLRLRQYDTLRRAFSEWAFSPIFQILTGVTNPVSVTALEYEPWSKRVKITLRVDDSELDDYNLTRFWYSRDDGDTWVQIPIGDISGAITSLSSDPTNGGNAYTVWWSTLAYNFAPGDEYRIRIESVPTGQQEQVRVPYLKFYAPANPVTDPAESEVQSYLGRVDYFSFDDLTQQWTPLTDPIYTPGQLRVLETEQERIRQAKTDVAPSGYYTFFSGSTLVDPSGYATWRAGQWSGPETRGAALNRVGIAIDNIIRVQLPDAHARIFEGERYCRKELIKQGYYAEAHFNRVGGSGAYDETVTADAFITAFDDGAPQEVRRNWRFRVQGTPEGPSDIFDDDGYLDPLDITNLERVFCKIQLDPSTAYDSQPYGKPLRTFLVDDTGARISMSTYDGGQLIDQTNAAIVDEQSDAGQPWEGQPSDRDVIGGESSQFSGTTPAPVTEVVTLGGALKIVPELLPGEVASDVLTTPSWEGDYYWRFCSYNAITDTVQARPRPLITGLTADTSDRVAVAYTAQAHEHITRISLTGYSISNQSVTPAWVDETAWDFVSDHRTPLTDTGTIINQFNWVPRGTNRPRPAVLYDNDLMQYVAATAKTSFSNRWRIVSSRAMCLPTVCEFEAYWDETPETAIYAPCLLKTDQFLMYATAQNGGLPYLVRSTSDDADVWTGPEVINGVSVGAYPTVVYHGGLYHLWYEKLSAGKVRIFYATSTDGQTFTAANAGAAVHSGSGDVGSPSVIRINNAWVMYFTDAFTGCIASVFSSDGITWSGYQTELMPKVVDIDGSSVLCTPKHPCAFLDRYLGNEELFLAFNYVTAGGEHRVYQVRLEDRVWRAGEVGKIYAEAGELTNAASSRGGTTHAAAVGLSANGLASAAGLKVRLAFGTFSPTTAEYHRQSEWVDFANADDLGGYLDPDPWPYDDALTILPYLEIL